MGALEQLQSLLRELFQYDCADLNFGIYRQLRLTATRSRCFDEMLINGDAAAPGFRFLVFCATN